MITSDPIVGWSFAGIRAHERVTVCAAHRPTPPDDLRCEPIRASEVDGEVCETCGATLGQD